MFTTYFTNPSELNQKLFESELNSGKKVIVQFSEGKHSPHLYDELNEFCQKLSNEFSIRFYGYHSDGFDCSILRRIPNVRSLSINCLNKALNIEALTGLQNLERLNLGIEELRETEILGSSNFKSLLELTIGQTKTRALNLEYLTDFKDLKILINCGHKKNIEAIGDLENLNYLSFNSVGKVGLEFVNKLAKLRTLKFILGGRENINELKGNVIENLEIIQVRGFKDAGFVNNFKALKSLLIEDQIQLLNVDFIKRLEYLETLRLMNCKNCNSLTGLDKLPNLKSLVVSRTGINFDEFIEQPLPGSIENLKYLTSKSKIDKEIEHKLKERGYN